eukprot:2994481-Pyramimonas_sp.AAC.2
MDSVQDDGAPLHGRPSARLHRTTLAAYAMGEAGAVIETRRTAQTCEEQGGVAVRAGDLFREAGCGPRRSRGARGTALGGHREGSRRRHGPIDGAPGTVTEGGAGGVA